MLEKNSVILNAENMDITKDALKILNKELPHQSKTRLVQCRLVFKKLGQYYYVSSQIDCDLQTEKNDNSLIF